MLIKYTLLAYYSLLHKETFKIILLEWPHPKLQLNMPQKVSKASVVWAVG